MTKEKNTNNKSDDKKKDKKGIFSFGTKKKENSKENQNETPSSSSSYYPTSQRSSAPNQTATNHHNNDNQLQNTSPNSREDDQALPDEEYDENDYIIARAVYDYEAGDTDEINLKAGEVVFVFHRHESGWWTGECMGQYGIFPASYIKLDPGQDGKRLPSEIQSRDESFVDARLQEEQENIRAELEEQLKRQEQLQMEDEERKRNEEPKATETINGHVQSAPEPVKTEEDSVQTKAKEEIEKIKREELEFKRQYSSYSGPSSMFKQSNIEELEREISDMENTRMSTAIRSPSQSKFSTPKDSQSEALKAELEQLRLQLQEATEKLDHSELRTAQLEIEVTTKEVLVAETLAKSKREIETLKEEVAKRDRDINEKADRLAKEYSEKEAKLVNGHKLKESELSSRISQESLRKQQLETENKNLQSDVQRLKQELEQHQKMGSMKDSEEKVKSVESLLEQTQAQLERERKQSEDLRKQLEEKIQSLETMVQRETKKNLEFQKHIQDLQSQLEKKKTQMEADKDREKALSQKNEKEKQDSETMQQLHNSLVHLRKEIDTMKVEQQTRRSRIIAPEQVHQYLDQSHKEEQQDTKNKFIEKQKYFTTNFARPMPAQDKKPEERPKLPPTPTRSAGPMSTSSDKLPVMPKRDVKPSFVQKPIAPVTQPAESTNSEPEKTSRPAPPPKPASFIPTTNLPSSNNLIMNRAKPPAKSPRTQLPIPPRKPDSIVAPPKPPVVSNTTTTQEDDRRTNTFEVKLRPTGVKLNK